MAEIAAGNQTEWFNSFLPAQLVLGDPACRDAAIHAIQACIPHARLVPIGVGEIRLVDARSLEQATHQARSVSQR